MAAKSSIDTRKTVVLTTSAIVIPAASRTARRLSSTRAVSASIPPSTSCPAAGSRPIWPEQKRSPDAPSGRRTHTAWGHFVGLPAFPLGVREKGEAELPGLGEELVLRRTVEGGSDDVGPRLAELGDSVTESLPLVRSPRGVGLRIPPEHHPAPAEIG